VTTDHDEIRRWVEARGGYPAAVIGTGSAGAAGVLRIDYPGYSGEDTLKRITWDEWFAKFDAERLAFLAQSETVGGDPSRFSKLIQRGARQGSRGRTGGGRSSTRVGSSRGGSTQSSTRRSSTRGGRGRGSR
jgi:hypothetical protein